MTDLRTNQPDMWATIAAGVSSATGEPFRALEVSPLGGGCINTAFRVAGVGRRYFVKINDIERLAMFEAEAAGLREIASSASIRVPSAICHGRAASASYLVLEFVDIDPCSGSACDRMGRALAAMHSHSRTQYGWNRDNTIGATPQRNAPCDDWIAFWRDNRLGFQLRLAASNGLDRALQHRGERLQEQLPHFFTGYTPPPSLLHGDLWGGNAGADQSGEPVIFDPAVYYGDRETDIAMTELFGGFSSRFYAAYREALPTDPGYPVRRNLYNLYHILNHANLFGGGYVAQAADMMDRLLSEVG